jgi:pilus assembly protein CpaC
MKFINLISIFLLISLPLDVLALEKVVKQNKLSMYVGEVRVIQATGVDRIAVGNGKLVSTSVLTNQLLMIAEGAGSGEIHVWFKNGKEEHYHVNVSASDTSNSYEQLDAILKAIPSVKLTRIGDHNVITGDLSKENLDRLDSVVKIFPQTINMAKEEDVAMKKMVIIRVKIMEFKTNALKNLGINWTSSIDGPRIGVYGDVVSNSTAKVSDATGFSAIGTGDLTTMEVKGLKATVGLASLITSKINLALNSGDATILAAPELSTRSGGEAKFLAGGEVPIVTTSNIGPTVTYKEYGIKLNIKPIADQIGNVMASVKAEVSSVDSSTTAGGFPGFLSRSSETIFNIKDGQTVAISGLISQETSKDVNGLAGLSSIPLFGELFKSTNRRNSQTEMVVFVTPSVVDPTSEVESSVARGRIDKMQEKIDNSMIEQPKSNAIKPLE